MTGSLERSIAVAGGELLLLAVLGFFAYRAWRHRDEPGGSVLLKLVLCMALLGVWGVIMASPTFTVWQRMVSAIAVHVASFILYLMCDEVFPRMYRHSRLATYWTMWLSRVAVFRITIGVVALLVVFAFLLGDNAPVFGTMSPGPRSWVFYTETAMGYALLVYVHTLIVWICVRDLHRLADPVDLAKRGLLALGIGINVLGVLGVEAGLFLSLVGAGNHEVAVVSFYQASVVITAALVAMAVIVPGRVIGLVVSPLATYLRWRQARQQELLAYLHQIVIRLAPTVVMAGAPRSELRLLIEIGDARLIIWSQEPHPELVTPVAEARHLLALLRANAVYGQLGEYDPPQRRESDIRKHNLAVARELRLLQAA